jgi:hypothetical protein
MRRIRIATYGNRTPWRLGQGERHHFGGDREATLPGKPHGRGLDSLTVLLGYAQHPPYSVILFSGNA